MTTSIQATPITVSTNVETQVLTNTANDPNVAVVETTTNQIPNTTNAASSETPIKARSAVRVFFSNIAKKIINAFRAVIRAFRNLLAFIFPCLSKKANAQENNIPQKPSATIPSPTPLDEDIDVTKKGQSDHPKKPIASESNDASNEAEEEFYDALESLDHKDAEKNGDVSEEHFDKIDSLDYADVEIDPSISDNVVTETYHLIKDIADAKKIKDLAVKATSVALSSAKDIGNSVVTKAKDIGNSTVTKAKDIGNSTVTKAKDIGNSVVNNATKIKDLAATSVALSSAKDIGNSVVNNATKIKDRFATGISQSTLNAITFATATVATGVAVATMYNTGSTTGSNISGYNASSFNNASNPENNTSFFNNFSPRNDHEALYGECLENLSVLSWSAVCNLMSSIEGYFFGK